MVKEVFGHLRKARLHHSDLGRQEMALTILPFLHLLPALHDATCSGISLWSAGISCPGCVLSQPIVHCQPIADRVG